MSDCLQLLKGAICPVCDGSGFYSNDKVNNRPCKWCSERAAVLAAEGSWKYVSIQMEDRTTIKLATNGDVVRCVSFDYITVEGKLRDFISEETMLLREDKNYA